MNATPQNGRSQPLANCCPAKWLRILVLAPIVVVFLASCAAPVAPASSPPEAIATAPEASAPSATGVEPLAGLSVLDTPAAPTEAPAAANALVAPSAGVTVTMPSGTPPPAANAAGDSTRDLTPAAPPVNPLDSPGAAPEGIPEQIFNTGGVFMLVGPFECVSSPAAGPEVYTLAGETIELGGFLDICLAGFAPAQAIDILIVGPNGEEWPAERTAGPDGTVTITWESAAGEPVGVYTVIAEQAASRAEGAFTVVEPSPVIDVPYFGERGERIPIRLRSFPPDEWITLYVYYAPPEALEAKLNSYWSSLAVMTDDLGQAEFELVTSPQHQPGRYVFAYLEPGAEKPTASGAMILE